MDVMMRYGFPWTYLAIYIDSMSLSSCQTKVDLKSTKGLVQTILRKTIQFGKSERARAEWLQETGQGTRRGASECSTNNVSQKASQSEEYWRRTEEERWLQREQSW